MSTPCIFDNTTVSTAQPLIYEAGPPACGLDPNGDPRCTDPQFALENKDLCPDWSPLASLSIVPSTGVIDVAGKYGYRALAVYANGKEKDVTDSATWGTGNASVAAVFSPGLISGIGVGSTTVSAAWGGLNAFATLTVVAQCIMDGIDVAVVISRAASMNLCDSGPDCATGDPRTRLEKCKAAVKTMVSNVLQTDQVAVVSFGGIIRSTGTTIPDTTLEALLNADKTVVDTAIDAIQTKNPCTNDAGDLLCASGIGSGLALAVQELNSTRARGGAVKKVIVLVTDGVENICNPDPETVAAAAIAAGILIIAVAIDVPDVTFLDCDGDTILSHAYLLSLVSSGMVYFEDSDGIGDVLSRIRNIICTGGYGYGYYYYFIPSNHHYLDKLDYTGWANWIAEWGVDLIGRDIWILLPPGHGAYCDMTGTLSGHPGTLLSKVFFDLPPGNYRFSVDLAGNQRADQTHYGATGLSMRFTIGTSVLPGGGVGTNGYVLDKTVTITDWKQNFLTYSWDFTVGSPGSGPIRMEQLALPDKFPNTVGTLLDNVILQNLDSGVILISDNFNTENAV